MTAVADLICTGRPVDDQGRPTGEPCGRRLRPLPHDTDADVVQRARGGGWAVGDEHPDGSRDVMCPRCRRPDPAIARGLTTLEVHP